MRTLSDEDLLRYLDDDCTPQEKQAFTKMIDEDPDLKIKLNQIRFAETSMSSLGLEDVPSGFTQKVVTELNSLGARSKSFDFKPWRFTLILVGLVVAATILVAEVPFQGAELVYTPPAKILDPVLNFIGVVGASEYFRNFALIITGLIALSLFDILVLKPLFSSRHKNLAT